MVAIQRSLSDRHLLIGLHSKIPSLNVTFEAHQLSGHYGGQV